MTKLPQVYVPCLRWKQGEYQALLQLPSDVSKQIFPLIEVAEIGWDFELKQDCKTVDEHLLHFARRVHDKWGRRSCFVDLCHIPDAMKMADGADAATFVFGGLQQRGVPATPVFRLLEDGARLNALKKAFAQGDNGGAFRIRLEEAARKDFKVRLDGLLAGIGAVPGNVHLVLDLGAPNFKPLDGLTGLVEMIIRRLPYQKDWLTLTLIGTAFPPTMAEVGRGLTRVDRSEWSLYKALVARLANDDVRVPAFGDYAISHPDVAAINPRFLKPSASLRYTVDDAWLIAKGVNVREHKFGQYRQLCEQVIKSGQFAGPDYSPADQYILDCAAGTASTGNLSVWRRIGTSHHLVKVVRDLATLTDTSASA